VKVLFVSANTEQAHMAVLPLGLACVAESVRQAGHDITVVDLMAEPDAERVLTSAIEVFQPDCIGVTVRNIDDQNMASPRFLLDETREAIGICRSRTNAPIVLGGAGYTLFARSALTYLGADMGIAGEGEAAFPELLSRMEQGSDISSIAGLVLPGRDEQIPPARSAGLDAWPLPDVSLLAGSATRHPDAWIPVQTRRGCPFKCNYCSTFCIEGTASRRRSPGQAADWLAAWTNAGHRQFFFVDNNFNVPASYAKELCREIVQRRLDIRFQAIIYPKHVDWELAGLMAEAGCVNVSLGFESGSLPVLQKMNKRFTPNEVRDISGLFGDAGIERMGFLLLGGPGETRETVEESLAFADGLHLELLRVTAGIRIYPDTALAATALEQGMVTPDDDLLFPRFYLVPELADWIFPRVKEWAGDRQNILL